MNRTPDTPLVSIGMPLYNSESWVADSIESILQQSEQDFELIISDNASTDRSYAIAEQYARRDPRIRLFRQETNSGAPANYRFVAGHARARHFKWATSSDLLSVNFLSECVHSLEAHPEAVLCYGQTRLFTNSIADSKDYEDGLQLGMADPVERFACVTDRLGFNNAINGVIRRDALMRTSIMPDCYSCDNLVVAELALSGTIIENRSAIFYRRMSPEASTKLKSAQQIRLHYFPVPRIGMLFQHWQLCTHYSSAVWRASLSLGQRSRLFMRTLKMWYWSVPDLLADIRTAWQLMRHRHTSADA